VTVDVCYETRGPFRCVKLARFVDQIAITDGTFSAGGDSGSLIVTADDKKNPVGLLFAGSDMHTIANPIGLVLDRFNVTIDDGSGASVSITPSSQSGQGFPGDTVSYTYTLTNTGDAEDTYSLSTSSTWASSVTPTSTTLGAGVSTDVVVQHSVPSTASPGDMDSGNLTALSTDTGASDEASFATTAQGYAVEITPESQSASAAPGVTVTYIYSVKNTGTETDSYSVSTSSNWTSSVDTTSLSLGAGASADVTVSHTIPEAAQDGQSDTGTLSVVSSNTSDSSSFTTTAKVTVGVSVGSISPNSMPAGSTINVTISGSGFAAGADVTFENGAGPAPEASGVSVAVDGTSLTATVTAKSGGPPKNRIWDVRVTNPDSSTDVLVDGFTVTP
jgi:hypothetical protein